MLFYHLGQYEGFGGNGGGNDNKKGFKSEMC
jgi:hypothetical protein